MYTHLKRAPARPAVKRGCRRSIRPERARDQDLHIFLQLSRHSRRVTSRDLAELIRPV
jgi:hypothetical protein